MVGCALRKNRQYQNVQRIGMSLFFRFSKMFFKLVISLSRKFSQFIDGFGIWNIIYRQKSQVLCIMLCRQLLTVSEQITRLIYVHLHLRKCLQLNGYALFLTGENSFIELYFNFITVFDSAFSDAFRG